MNATPRKLRVLFSADDCGHSGGYYVLAQAMRDSGIEVILGGPQIPREIVHTAMQEGADVIAYRIMSAYPTTVVSRLMKLLQEQDMRDIPVVIGGVILPKQVEQLKGMGVAGIFPVGCSLDSVVDYFKGLSKNRKD